MRWLLTAVAAVALFARDAQAQVPTASSRWQPEVRVDGFTSDPWAAHVGAGVGLRVGYNARIALVGGVGASGDPDEADVGNDGNTFGRSGRIELLGRFVLDPFREQARGPYAAGGIVQRLEHGARPRTVLTAVIGIEGQPRGGWAPSLEAGFGGGVRLGIVLRRALPDGR